MLLFEFENSPLQLSVVATVNQLKAEIDSGQRDSKVTENDLLNLLRNNEVYINSSQLRDMIQNPPLKNIIKDIKNNMVIFKGQEMVNDIEKKEKNNKTTVDSMAKKALKKDRKLKVKSDLKK